MRIVHFSDTHLGFQAFDQVTPQGINAREQDVYDAFAHTIQRILELKPDAVVHSGDFFHRPSPSNRALTVALEQLRRLCDARIPVYVIAGNHETPKTVFTSPILRAFRSLDCVRPFFGEAWETAELDGLVIHGLPHINDTRILQEQLEKMQPRAGKFNLLMLHTSLGKRFLMEEYGEQMFPENFIEKLAGFQYIALGHWHNFQKIDLHANAWYCGSIERLSETEIGSEKGFMVLEIDKKGQCATRFEAVPTRPWLKLEIQNCRQKPVAELRGALEQFAGQQTTSGAIISLIFNDIKVEQSLELSNAFLKELFPEALQILPRRRSFSDRNFVRQLEADQFDRLDQIFNDYIREKFPDNPQLAAQIAEKAAYYFHSTP